MLTAPAEEARCSVQIGTSAAASPRQTDDENHAGEVRSDPMCLEVRSAVTAARTLDGRTEAAADRRAPRRRSTDCVVAGDEHRGASHSASAYAAWLDAAARDVT